MSIRTSFCILLLSTAMLATACAKRDLRGWWKPSSDGKTYLVLDDGNGLKKGQFCSLDNAVWPYGVGERGEIKPGGHEMGCPENVGFTVSAGVEYHFDHWGP